MIKSKITVKTQYLKITDKAWLIDKWQQLYLKSEGNVFLSTAWIKSWFNMLGDHKLILMEAFQDEDTVGLAVFIENTRKVLSFYSVKQWWLHRTGDEEKDQIWIEYNDFLLDKKIANDAREAMINALVCNKYGVNEIVIGLSSTKILDSFKKYYKCSNNIIETKGYAIDFSFMKSNFLQENVSKNTRSQINRSKKLLMEQGGLTLEIVSNSNEILTKLPRIANIHKQLWEDTAEGSGFNNSFFTQFHQSLIKNNSTIIQLCILTQNNKEIGYLYNFIINNRVYFYLSAIEKSSDNRIKVGLVLHSLAIQYYLENGMQSYDFLGGDARYKRSLSNVCYGLALTSFFNQNFILQLENKLKKIKSFFLNCFHH